MNVIPAKCLFHFIALLPEPGEVARFFGRLKASRPGITAEGEGWKIVTSPRQFAFGTLSDGPWSWRVVVDLGELPESAWRPGFGDAKPPEHRAHAFVFLVSAPEEASGLERVQASFELARVWVEVGATAIAFPSAGAVNGAEVVRALEPAGIDAEAATAMFISLSLMGQGGDGRTWVRTRGMSQFGLVDLCYALPPVPQPPAEALDSARILFGSVAPYLISTGRSLEPQETVQLGERVFRVGEAEKLQGAPPYFGELRLLEYVAK